jgi:hypothetical protein
MKLLQVNRIAVVLLAVVFFLFLLIGIWLFQKSGDEQYAFNASSRTVIKELRELNRLETAAFTIEKVIDAGTNGNRFQEILFGDRILLIAHGNVIAGFDLSQLKENDVTVDGRTLRLTLPPPQILTASLDSQETRVYDRQQGYLTRGDKDLEARARAEAEKIIRQAACEGKILSEAEKNGRNQLTTLFKALGFETVILTIPQGKC